MKIKIRVKPKSKVEKIEKQEDFYVVYVKSEPKNGKANQDVLKLLKKYFKKNAKIVSGHTSKIKIIELF